VNTAGPSPVTLALLDVELAHWFRETRNPMLVWWALAGCPSGVPLPPWADAYVRDAARQLTARPDAVLEALDLSRPRSKGAHSRLRDLAIAQGAALHTARGERDPVRAVTAAGGRYVEERQARRIIALGRRLNRARPAADGELQEVRRLDRSGRCVIEFLGPVKAMLAPFSRPPIRQRITVPPDLDGGIYR
jgi:hypothetical protein